jgi:putative effector of murein hydrolase LrgA (UPF0299 family)
VASVVVSTIATLAVTALVLKALTPRPEPETERDHV